MAALPHSTSRRLASHLLHTKMVHRSSRPDHHRTSNSHLVCRPAFHLQDFLKVRRQDSLLRAFHKVPRLDFRHQDSRRQAYRWLGRTAGLLADRMDRTEVTRTAGREGAHRCPTKTMRCRLRCDRGGTGRRGKVRLLHTT